jgi:hypothetical protein
MANTVLVQLPCDCSGPRSNRGGVATVDVVVDEDVDVVDPESVVDVVVVPELEPFVVVGTVVVEPVITELAGGGRELSPPLLVADEAPTVR